MNELKSFLYVILEAQAANAAEIHELQKKQEAAAEDLRDLKRNQEKILSYLEGNSYVREEPLRDYHLPT
ncbi:MAG TPA: hypothetical protein VFT51_04720 [Bacillales bacterium]|nr:hypothetical protein [Bacillales bacterium]